MAIQRIKLCYYTFNFYGLMLVFSILILNCQKQFFRSDLFFKYDRNNCCIIEKNVNSNNEDLKYFLKHRLRCTIR